MGKKKNSPGVPWLLHKRNPSGRRRLTRKGAAVIKDSITGVMTDMIEGHGRGFVPISINDVRLSLRRDYDLFLTYTQVGNYMRKLVEEGMFEKEDHHRDRTAQHWSDQFSQYRLPQPSTDNPGYLLDSAPGPDPGRQDQGSDSDTPLE